jgi:hypothetical protein
MRRDHEAWAIRAEIEQLGARGRGRAYPEAIRRRAVAYYRARRDEGAVIAGIGPELGLPWQTVQRWAALEGQHELQPASFAPVEILDATTTDKRGHLIVHGPAGLRIEGLDMDALVELCRRLA